MDRQVKEPSDVLSEFLNYIDRMPNSKGVMLFD